MIPKSNMYIDTPATPEMTKAEIHKILAKFGILERRWTEMGPENTFLEFIIKQEGRPNIKVKINVPFVESSRRPGNRGPLIVAYDEKRSYRFLYHYIKALLSARDVEFGTIEEVFMSHIVMPLPDGREATMGEVLQEQLKTGEVPRLMGFNLVPASAALPPPPSSTAEDSNSYLIIPCGEPFNYDDPDGPALICVLAKGHEGDHNDIRQLERII